MSPHIWPAVRALPAAWSTTAASHPAAQSPSLVISGLSSEELAEPTGASARPADWPARAPTASETKARRTMMAYGTLCHLALPRASPLMPRLLEAPSGVCGLSSTYPRREGPGGPPQWKILNFWPPHPFNARTTTPDHVGVPSCLLPARNIPVVGRDCQGRGLGADTGR